MKLVNMDSLENSVEIIRPLLSSNEDISMSDERYINFQLSINDNGVGISEEGQKNLFIDFGKLKENESRNASGTGLGLSICKKIIEQMGGSVEIESQVGVGTKFIISLKTKCKVVKTQF